MSKYNQFVFENYLFEPTQKKLTLNYAYNESLTFQETYVFDFEFVRYDPAVLERALQLVFLLAGISYYKVFLAPTTTIQQAQVDDRLAEFLKQTYQNGLGEFFYTNKLDPRTPIDFPVTSQEKLNTLSVSGEGLLVGLGGGKDSLVSVELLRGKVDLATWSMGHQEQLKPLVKTVGLPHYWVKRIIDPQLLELKNNPRAFNGHIPISSLFAAVGVVVAILTGRRDVVVSNESSASEPNLMYQGVPINHQYSKSLEFEGSFQQLLQLQYGEDIRYYSLLRPFTELRIAELFIQTGFEKYKSIFSSCNRAFTQHSYAMSWCGECPKCAFVFLIFSPFLERSILEELFGGKNLLLDPALEPTYRQLLGIEGTKPLECVGEVKESRAAMRLAQKVYPELKKYEFELPEDYNFRSLSDHALPTDAYDILQASLPNQP